MAQRARVFFSYATEDDAHRIRLEKHLSQLKREGLIESWHFRKLLAGQDWDRRIDDQLRHADVILLLVSADFLASSYIYDVELELALEREAAGEAVVIPVHVEPCDWRSSSFAGLQGLPAEAKPVSTWRNQEEAWADVTRGIRQAIEARAGGAAPGSESARGTSPDPRRYLETVLAENSFVDLRGMGAQVAERLELSEVYTRLTVAAPASAVSRAAGDRLEAMREREVDLLEVLDEHHHAVLVGDPGSGKTTFLRYLAQRLARVALGGDTRLPVFVRLADLARFLIEHPDGALPEDAPEHLWRYLDHTLAGHGYRLPADYLSRRLRAGGCFLLLDGLDEVPGSERRERLGRLIEKVVAAGVAAGNRHLITCRTRAYQGRVELAGAELAVFHLAPFGDEQVAEFVRRWSRALRHLAPDDENSAAAVDAEKYRAELQEAIAAHPAVAPMTENPLMLTVLAVVHWNRKRLPEQRAELYAAAVDYLLDSRRGQSAHTPIERQEALQAIALRMFEDPEGVQRSLGRIEAAAAAKEALGIGKAASVAFLEEETLHSGLLVSRSEGEVEFWHLTFQEFLAGRELTQLEHTWERLSPHLFNDRWSEVVLLAAGCLRREQGPRVARAGRGPAHSCSGVFPPLLVRGNIALDARHYR